MNRFFKAEIAENIQISRDHNLLTFIPMQSIKEPEPGQFYMIGAGSCHDPLLKRPFSLFRRTSKGIQILYRIKGQGTLMLRDMRPGFMIDVLGPLGNSYPVPAVNQTPLIVAGGIGMASLFSLAERFAKSAYIFYGARTTQELLFLEELGGYAKSLSVSTDDGSSGKKGTVGDMLDGFLTQNPSLVSSSVLYACGPSKMLEFVSRVAKDRNMVAYISMEENMACGIGACLGCVVKTAEGYKRVCMEGPVFDVREIAW